MGLELVGRQRGLPQVGDGEGGEQVLRAVDGPGCVGTKLGFPLPPLSRLLPTSALLTVKSKVTGELRLRPESSPTANWCSKRSSSVSGPQRANVSRCTEGGSSRRSPENCGKVARG